MTEPADQEAAWHEETAEWPDKVREVARRYPAYECWRSDENPEFHYKIIDYAHHRATGEVLLTLVHARGTSRAGVATYGQAPGQLIRCGCGKWAPPTDEEKERIGAHIRKVRETIDETRRMKQLYNKGGKPS